MPISSYQPVIYTQISHFHALIANQSICVCPNEGAA